AQHGPKNGNDRSAQGLRYLRTKTVSPLTGVSKLIRPSTSKTMPSFAPGGTWSPSTQSTPRTALNSSVPPDAGWPTTCTEKTAYPPQRLDGTGWPPATPQPNGAKLCR